MRQSEALLVLMDRMHPDDDLGIASAAAGFADGLRLLDEAQQQQMLDGALAELTEAWRERGVDAALAREAAELFCEVARLDLMTPATRH